MNETERKSAGFSIFKLLWTDSHLIFMKTLGVDTVIILIL